MEKEVVKTVEVPVEVIRTVEVPIEVPVTEVVMVPGQAYVTDPTNGLVYTAPQYGGMFIVGGRGNRQPTTTDQTVGGWNDGWTVSGVLERLGQADWAIDRRVNPLNNEWLQEKRACRDTRGKLGAARPKHFCIQHPRGRQLA